MSRVPISRLRTANDAPLRADRDWVVYWMIGARRVRWSFAVQHALDLAKELGKPLLVLEPLRCGYPYASDRIHRFVLDGMRDTARRLEKSAVRYYPYVEPEPDAGKGLLEAMGRRAAALVTDEVTVGFLPRMVAAAAQRLDVRLDVVDGNGLLPIRATEKSYATAYAFRRFLQKHLPDHLEAFPRANPFSRISLPRPPLLPSDLRKRWPEATPALLAGKPAALARLPIDHEVVPVDLPGGAAAARRRLDAFVRKALPEYAERRNEPEADATSRLSPYLHFGHVGAHEVFDAVRRAEKWTLDDLSAKSDGSRAGWWGMSESVEAFLDQLVTWRELGLNFTWHRDDAAEYAGLPDWARETLRDHAGDPREHRYARTTFEGARTHDPLWNAAQVQLRREGRIHNYLRMLWGKKVLEWSATPERAFRTLVHLNDRWALDGRDANSYSGVAWCLGRYDRPWGPERLIFGKVRYMTSRNTARKVRVRGYLEKYGADRRL